MAGSEFENIKLKLIDILNDIGITVKAIDDQNNWLVGISAGSLILLFSNFTNFVIKTDDCKGFIPDYMLLLISIGLLMAATIAFGLTKNVMFLVKLQQKTIRDESKSANSIGEIQSLLDKTESHNNLIKISNYMVLIGLPLLYLGLISFAIYVIKYILNYNHY